MDQYDYGDQEDFEDYDYQDEEFTNYQGSNLKILMVAEKNSIAEAVAYAIGSKVRAKKGRQAFFYFSGMFKGQQANFTVTATNGHLFSRDFPKEYENWNSCDPIELFQAKTIKKAANKAAIGLLKKCSSGIDYLILWLDNDREGENICFEVDEICNSQGRAKKLRAKFSSITQTDLKYAYNQLNSGPNILESESVDARQIIDLKVGVAFSRFQTLHFQKKYSMDQMVTFGPCQTPTLGFCVERHEEIANFVPKAFYTIKLSIVNNVGFKQEVEWLGQQIWKEQEAKLVVQQLLNYKQGDVISQQIEQKSKPRPEGINTVSLLKFASSYLGLGPQQAMHVAERLYLKGYISYPRTETTAYPHEFPTPKIINNLQKYKEPLISEHSKYLKTNGHSNPKQGVDVGDHPPITPTENVPQNDLYGEERTMYEYVVKMFLAAHSKDCKYENHTLKFIVNDHQFKYQAKYILDPGFTKIATWLAITENKSDLTKFVTNNKVQIGFVEYQQGQTSPPDHLTETELITLMDKFKIGTDASMATHINNICERQYVKVEGQSRKLKPTDLGLSLVRGYKRIDPDLVAPQLRSNIESQVDQIAKGKLKCHQVIDEVIQIFTKKYIHFRDRINDFQLIQYHQQGINKQIKQQVEEIILSRCGDCNRYLVQSNNSAICKQCIKTYPLLPDCKFKAYGAYRCPFDKFELLFCTSNKSPFNTTLLCPKCFSQSPLVTSDQCTCNICPNVDCEKSKESRMVGKCKSCKIGELILEPFISKGQQICISCNECWCLYQLVPAILQVDITKNACAQCQLKTFNLLTKTKDKEEIKYSNVCLLCHEELNKKLLYAPYLGEKKFMIQQKKQDQPVKEEEINKETFSKGRKKFSKNPRKTNQRDDDQFTQKKNDNADWAALLLAQSVANNKQKSQKQQNQEEGQQNQQQQQQINEPGLVLIEQKKKRNH
ncbi:unnamed protein product [Paramecium pentaurelia]|uniref:DNA topoisomerase n=1 Tax=Paramecium pentaurelia TaxID=43138 RepID=A0A8S1T709_9CILI|nr:unnamed protein product [Paramecium pentaurelia]